MKETCHCQKQKLVNICFEIAFVVNSMQTRMDREKLGDWVASQLRECGFDTEPRGLSWGVLLED